MQSERIILGYDSERPAAVLRKLYAPFVRNHDRVLMMKTHEAEMTNTLPTRSSGYRPSATGHLSDRRRLGVFGLLLAFGLYFPRRLVMLILPPIPMPAWLFVLLCGALELFLGVTGTQQGVAHFAHLGAMLVGYLCIRAFRTRSPRGF